MTGKRQRKEAKINMGAVTDNEIMKRLQASALAYGVRLTYAQKVFYLRLVAYAAVNGESCPEGLKIYLSVNEMAAFFDISKRMVTKCLRIFTDCGILLRYNGMTFPRSAITIIKKEFYERSNT